MSEDGTVQALERKEDFKKLKELLEKWRVMSVTYDGEKDVYTITWVDANYDDVVTVLEGEEDDGEKAV